jgi:hypothetical protein
MRIFSFWHSAPTFDPSYLAPETVSGTGLGKRSTASNVGGLIRPTVFKVFQIFFAEYLWWLTSKRIASGHF